MDILLGAVSIAALWRTAPMKSKEKVSKPAVLGNPFTVSGTAGDLELVSAVPHPSISGSLLVTYRKADRTLRIPVDIQGLGAQDLISFLLVHEASDF